MQRCTELLASGSRPGAGKQGGLERDSVFLLAPFCRSMRGKKARRLTFWTAHEIIPPENVDHREHACLLAVCSGHGGVDTGSLRLFGLSSVWATRLINCSGTRARRASVLPCPEHSSPLLSLAPAPSRPAPLMDPPSLASQGPPYSAVRQQLFHSSHLPPPSQLHLPPVNAARSNVNTLPPLNSPSARVSPYGPRHASPPPSSSLPWPAAMHRTSSSRDDALPTPSSLHHPQSVHPYAQPAPRPAESRQMKREQPPPPAPPPQAPSKDVDDNMPATCDFVKKLYKYVSCVRCTPPSHHPSSRMLEDQSFAHVVSWGPNGDCFVVKVCAGVPSGVMEAD